MKSIEFNEDTGMWEGERLKFRQQPDPDYYMILNSDGHLLGYLERMRIGRFLHWCLTLNHGCYLSPGCNDEVRMMQSMLYGIHRKQIKCNSCLKFKKEYVSGLCKECADKMDKHIEENKNSQ